MKVVHIFKNYKRYQDCGSKLYYWYYEYSPGKFSPSFNTATEAIEDAEGFGYIVEA
jgi:hypothetical protein